MKKNALKQKVLVVENTFMCAAKTKVNVKIIAGALSVTKNVMIKKIILDADEDSDIFYF